VGAATLIVSEAALDQLAEATAPDVRSQDAESAA
jgi:hypothetical protein